MLEILKRSGKTEPYDADKIRNTLADASDEIGRPLSASALNSIVRQLEVYFEGKKRLTSQQIYVLLIGILHTRGMHELAEHYADHRNNAWKNS